MELSTNPDPATRPTKRARLHPWPIKPWVNSTGGETNPYDIPSYGVAGTPQTANLIYHGAKSSERASHVSLPISPSPRSHLSTAARESRDSILAPATAHQPQPPNFPRPSSNKQQRLLLPQPRQDKERTTIRPAVAGALPPLSEPETPEPTHPPAKPIPCPFPVEEDRLTVSTRLRYHRPENREVDSFVKFNLPNPPPASKWFRNNNSRGTPVLRDSYPEPKMPLPHFGLEFPSETGYIKIRLFQFYVKSWCTGRSSDGNTNPWRRDFGAMHRAPGVSCAIQTLAGTHLYDYWPQEALRKHVNEQYTRAVTYLQKLLSNRQTGQVEGNEDVLVTVVILLAMNDIALDLTKQQPTTPYTPDWLKAFWLCEQLLRDADNGGRFWRDENVPRSQLRNSQSIIVGRYVILNESMRLLPSPESLNPGEECDRFSHLFDGLSKSQAFEIQVAGGCSVMVLHIISQTTYNTARLQQEPGSIVVPRTAYFLEKQLLEMSQWDRGVTTWEESKQRPRPIEWIRSRPEDSVIDSRQDLTVAIAEMCRITGLIYLQCRLLRLPRNHTDVVRNISDLAKCVGIMPTSGLHFTAQAPLLPVFLLALLATTHDHQSVAEAWFQNVCKEPVRSNVHSAYSSVKRIRGWIDRITGFPQSPNNIPDSIAARDPWWERLVTEVCKMEGLSCLG